jgi:hypothetical protein
MLPTEQVIRVQTELARYVTRPAKSHLERNIIKFAQDRQTTTTASQQPLTE